MHNLNRYIVEFKMWLAEVGGSGGLGGGMTPPLENPLLRAGAFMDYHDDSGKEPDNQSGELPPVKKIHASRYKKRNRQGR